MVKQGASSAEITVRFPQFKPSSLRVVISKLRKDYGLASRARGPGLPLPEHINKALQVEAAGRPGFGVKHGHDLALLLLDVIVRDNLFDAILGEDGAP